jgi:short-subunit dehydrogenase
MAVSKAVLITGCSTGIGRATAAHLAASGWRVYATARRPESIQDLAGRGCRTLALDVCDEASMRAAVETVERAEGAVGVLINNAGYGQEGAFEETAMLPGMRRQHWGRVVNLSSMGGRLTLPGGAFYHATKYALEALSDALRFEVRPFGVDVIVIQPGPIRTQFGDTAIAAVKRVESAGSPYAEFNQVLARKIREAYEGPMGRLAAEPEAVARVIERAITAEKPRTRYVITFAARFMMALRRWLPDRAFDGFLRTQFPQRAG